MTKTNKFRNLLLILILILSGCTTSHLTCVGRDNWAAAMSKSALTTGELSYKTEFFLVKCSLSEYYNNDHQKVIERLALFIENPNDKTIPGENSRIDALSAIIELCTYQAQQTSGEETIKYWMSAAYYSYKYLFDKSLNHNPTAYNSLDYAANIRFYNYAMSNIFPYCVENNISLEKTQTFPLVLSTVEFLPAHSDLIWSYTRFTDYVNGYDYLPKNMQSHSYVGGLGVPMLGLQKYAPVKDKDIALLSMIYPFTFLIKFESFDLSKSSIKAQPEFYDSFKSEYIKINSEEVPLSKDYTLAIAKFIDSYKEMISGIDYMFNPEAMANLQGIYMFSPYDPNKIPVLLTHGLMSNPRTWTEMLNTLLGNQRIRENYQFWLYTYPTGQPIFYSEYQFRTAIMDLHQKYDPQSRDFCFNHMVLIGHSMGGVLSRLAVQDSQGTKFAEKALEANSLDELNLDDKEKIYLKNIGIFKPIPFIGCVILISAPNRGSDMATWKFSRIGSYLITLPVKVTQGGAGLVKKAAVASGLKPDDNPIPTGIDSLKPSNRYLKTSVDLPFKDNLEIHTIIGNENKAGERSGSDGVVPYSSAHLDNTQSEIVIKSSHGAHQTTEGIREVTRILLEYLDKLEKEKK
ncbi:MAG TPA: hypothetical protein DD381_11130 [Lentisphaeria bacterium]|nr:MAG: hypothetical protein A2X47_00470 [Lentisphaerae bacterium GWF2_38_69]HBM16881.1 hypothetical protein [Lentisphaeria bacterium]